MLSITNLSKRYGSIPAVNELSFQVKAGEIFALLGPNGAGKTTTLKIILGLLRPDQGEVKINGTGVVPWDSAHKFQIGYVPENGAVYESLTGREYLRFVSELYHLDPDAIARKTDRLLDLLGLKPMADQILREYSKGMKQKIMIVAALLPDPRLIILDEPFPGLDANTVSVFKEILRRYARDGKAILLSSHMLEMVEHLADRVLIIYQGTGRVCGTAAEVMAAAGQSSLDRAFNVLTGVRDIAAQAGEIVETIHGRGEGEGDGRGKNIG
ncbi:MAG: ABC transporter ATP-binding protein [candidate division Zixibacteria bacterium]|nr:ABC transporter ATP-binding protein [candidate division Zixibacteria bacterium]